MLTFAWPGVVQVKSVPLLCALQVAFRGKEFTWCIICFVVCPTNLRINNKVTIKRSTAAAENDASASPALTWSSSLTLEAQSDGSWHTHAGLSSASSLHVFPRLQGKSSHGSRGLEPHCDDLWPICVLKPVSRISAALFYSLETRNQWLVITSQHPPHSSAISLYSDLI